MKKESHRISNGIELSCPIVSSNKCQVIITRQHSLSNHIPLLSNIYIKKHNHVHITRILVDIDHYNHALRYIISHCHSSYHLEYLHHYSSGLYTFDPLESLLREHLVNLTILVVQIHNFLSICRHVSISPATISVSSIQTNHTFASKTRLAVKLFYIPFLSPQPIYV